MVGKDYETGGIAKDGAKLVTAVASSVVPKLTVVIGGSFGAGNYGMSGRAYDPRFLWMWPNARISVMGGEQAACGARHRPPRRARGQRRGVVGRGRGGVPRPDPQQYERQGSPYYSTARLWDDGVIDPVDTRRVLGLGLAAAANAPVPAPSYGPLPDVRAVAVSTGPTAAAPCARCSSPTAARSRCGLSGRHAPPACGPSPCTPTPTRPPRTSGRRHCRPARAGAGRAVLPRDRRILAAARRTGADAVHPGYGFLSESAAFARACEDAGLVFVGPPSDVIAAHGPEGRRTRGRRAGRGARAAGGRRPAPGTGDRRARADLADFPLLVKAAAGGGGKGMRVVRDAAGLPAAIAAARREAHRRSVTAPSSSSGTSRAAATSRSRSSPTPTARPAPVRARLLGPAPPPEGRRGGPGPELSPALRKRLNAAGAARPRGRLRRCRHGGVPRRRRQAEAYLLEMNTRLQVEHPVTECRHPASTSWTSSSPWRAGSGCRWVRRTSAVTGHAIEARVYAEDPWLPPAGRHRHHRALAGDRPHRHRPRAGPGVRHLTTRCSARLSPAGDRGGGPPRPRRGARRHRRPRRHHEHRLPAPARRLRRLPRRRYRHRLARRPRRASPATPTTSRSSRVRWRSPCATGRTAPRRHRSGRRRLAPRRPPAPVLVEDDREWSTTWPGGTVGRRAGRVDAGTSRGQRGRAAATSSARDRRQRHTAVVTPRPTASAVAARPEPLHPVRPAAAARRRSDGAVAAPMPGLLATSPSRRGTRSRPGRSSGSSRR